MTGFSRIRGGVLGLVLCGAVGVVVAKASDPDALWKIVHGSCVPHEQKAENPAPCAAVSLTGGYAVLKDNSPVKPLQFLLIPTERITGIEDPALLDAAAPNYWPDAWRARRFVEGLAKRPLSRDEIGLAVNSQYARTQDQLHIHVACLRPEVRAALSRALGAVGPEFAPLPEPLEGHAYRALRIPGDTLGTADPFRLVAAAGGRDHMGRETIVVTGADFADGPGFLVLNGEEDAATGDRGGGEQLVGPEC